MLCPHCGGETIHGTCNSPKATRFIRKFNRITTLGLSEGRPSDYTLYFTPDSKQKLKWYEKLLAPEDIRFENCSENASYCPNCNKLFVEFSELEESI